MPSKRKPTSKPKPTTAVVIPASALIQRRPFQLNYGNGTSPAPTASAIQPGGPGKLRIKGD